MSNGKIRALNGSSMKTSLKIRDVETEFRREMNSLEKLRTEITILYKRLQEDSARHKSLSANGGLLDTGIMEMSGAYNSDIYSKIRHKENVYRKHLQKASRLQKQLAELSLRRNKISDKIEDVRLEDKLMKQRAAEKEIDDLYLMNSAHKSDSAGEKS